MKIIGGPHPRAGSTLSARNLDEAVHNALEQIEQGSAAMVRRGGIAVTDGFVRIDARFVGPG